MVSDVREAGKVLLQPENFLTIIFFALSITGLYLVSLENYLLFHGIIELISIVIAFIIFILVWNTRRIAPDTFFLFIGISFLFIGSIDILHMLAYKGMGVFPGNSSDLPTQLWIAARYFQAITFFIATLLIGKSLSKDRKYDSWIIFGCCAAACTLLLTSIFVWHNFPHCFNEGQGLTPFKVASEYIISIVLVATVVVLVIKRRYLDSEVWSLLIAAQLFLVAGELAFTSYVSVYGSMNMLGHLFKLVAFYLFYRAIVVVGLKRPYDLLFRELKQKEAALIQSENLLNEMGSTAQIGGWEFDTETLTQVWTEEVYRIHDVDRNYKPSVSDGIGFYAPTSRPNIENAVKRAIEFGEPFDLELEVVTAKGNHRLVHAIGKAYQENGKTKKVS
ncbi:MAG: PAS domain-containing protein, partial [Methanoregula sp.]|nr:PAS domain-containing protein [Methanoregula sp.]